MTSLQAPPAVRPAQRSRRSFWLHQMRVWHWVSSAVCLSGFLLFTVTGITLNHAAEISAKPKVTGLTVRMPKALAAGLEQDAQPGKRPLPAPVAGWLRQSLPISGPVPPGERNGSEIYISMPRPGGDAWVNIDLRSGLVEYERTDRGWIAYLNDLHKGRHTGVGWQVFIDVLAAACLVFCVTGVVLLFLHASKRPATWPAVAFGLAVPIVLALVFIH